MSRQVLTDGSGKWFDDEKSVKFKESIRWDGRNHISAATGSQWEHESLYYTRSGLWVLNSWSQRQGTAESYTIIDENRAAQWLVEQNCFDDEELEQLPPNVKDVIIAAFSQAEI